MRLLLASLFFAINVHAEGIVVFGDSISAQEYSWPSYLTEHNKVLAQGGRAILDYDPPRDLKAGHPFDKAVYFLGTNDAHLRYPVERVVSQFIAHIDFITQRGFKTLVIIPPKMSRIPGEVRTALFWTCVKKQYVCKSLSSWDSLQTYDGIHPTPELSQSIAADIETLLETLK